MTLSRIAHVACWVTELDAAAFWWVATFGADVGDTYVSRNRPGFRSRLVRLGDGLALELMAGPWVGQPQTNEHVGWSHVAIGVGSVAEVDRIAATQGALGCLQSGPRWTGDGAYEAVLRGPNGMLIEITP
jgi:lactoylglutathione lyase